MATFARFACAAAMMSGAFVTALASVALVSHIPGGEPKGWFNTQVPMAVDTAACLIALGISDFCLGKILDWHTRKCKS